MKDIFLVLLVVILATSICIFLGFGMIKFIRYYDRSSHHPCDCSWKI